MKLRLYWPRASTLAGLNTPAMVVLCLTRDGWCARARACAQRKQGAIILATGGDNSNSAKGNFYEGFMATGVASEATDAAIQANIVAVGYSGFNIPADA